MPITMLKQDADAIVGTKYIIQAQGNMLEAKVVKVLGTGGEATAFLLYGSSCVFFPPPLRVSRFSFRSLAHFL